MVERLGTVERVCLFARNRISRNRVGTTAFPETNPTHETGNEGRAEVTAIRDTDECRQQVCPLLQIGTADGVD